MNGTSCKTVIAGLALGLVFAFPALAGEIAISGQVAHLEGDEEHGMHLAIFMTVENSGAADRLYAVRTPVAKSAELESKSEANVVAGNRAEATAFLVQPGETLTLTDDGPHIELLGLKRPLVPGEKIAVTLFFEKAGRVKIDVPVEAENH